MWYCIYSRQSNVSFCLLQLKVAITPLYTYIQIRTIIHTPAHVFFILPYISLYIRCYRLRSYLVQYTASRPICEVKSRWADLVLGWVTTGELSGDASFSSFCCFILFHMLATYYAPIHFFLCLSLSKVIDLIHPLILTPMLCSLVHWTPWKYTALINLCFSTWLFDFTFHYLKQCRNYTLFILFILLICLQLANIVEIHSYFRKSKYLKLKL